MPEKRNYDNIVKYLEYSYFLSYYAIKETINFTDIGREDFKFLLIAKCITTKKGYFFLKDVEVALRAPCYSDLYKSVTRLLELGYYERSKGRKFYTGFKFRTTGKAVYLCRKYTDIMRRLLKESENLGFENQEKPKRKRRTKKQIMRDKNKSLKTVKVIDPESIQ